MRQGTDTTRGATAEMAVAPLTDRKSGSGQGCQWRLLLGVLVLEAWSGRCFWLVIDYHFLLYNADVVFPLAFRAKKGKVQQHCILINPDPRFASANRTMHPFGSFIVYNNTPPLKILCVKRLGCPILTE